LVVSAIFDDDESYSVGALCLFEKLLFIYAGVFLMERHPQ